MTSSTFWANAFNIGVAIYTYIYAPETFTPDVSASWLIGTSLVNKALRFKTKTGITLK